MKRLLLFLSLCFSIVVTSEEALSLGVDKVLATVNDEVVTLSDYRLFVMKTDPSLDKEKVDEKLLKRLIEEKMILQEARKAKVTVSDEELEQNIRDFMKENSLTREEFENTITRQGMTVPEYRKWLQDNIIVLYKFADKEVDSKVAVTDADIADYFKKHSAEFVKKPERYTVSVIFLKLPENPKPTEITDLKIRALKIYDRLKAGEPFGKLASEFSVLKSKDKEGSLGEINKGQLVPELEACFSAMKENDFSGPVWVADGVYLIKLIKRSAVEYLSLDEAKEKIRALIFKQRRDVLYNEWTRNLWSKSSIKIKDR